MLVIGSFFTCSLALASAIPVKPADFETLKGETFKVIQVGKSEKQWSKSVDLVLVDSSRPVSNGPIEQFVVRFKGPKSTQFTKSVYRFEHVKTGSFELFLEPAGQDKKFDFYQAIFNLLKQK